VIDFDQNATTPLDPAVSAEMVEFLQDEGRQGNPSSVHRRGRRARDIVEAARRDVGEAVGCAALDVALTGGGTESNNLAITGSCRALRAKQKPSGLLTSVIEHPSILDAARALEGEVPVHWVHPDRAGLIDADDVAKRLRDLPDVGVVSLSVANQELGSVTPLEPWVVAVREVRPDVLCHADAVQAFGKMELHFDRSGLDLMSISAHKVHGPKGVGALLVRRGVELSPIIVGGAQERGLRAGTESVHAIVGFGVAARLAVARRASRIEAVQKMRRRLVEVLRNIEGTTVHGDDTR
jgi:cysteine desulfurase